MRRNSFVQAALTGRIGVRLSGGGAAALQYYREHLFSVGGELVDSGTDGTDATNTGVTFANGVATFDGSSYLTLPNAGDLTYLGRDLSSVGVRLTFERLVVASLAEIDFLFGSANTGTVTLMQIGLNAIYTISEGESLSAGKLYVAVRTEGGAVHYAITVDDVFSAGESFDLRVDYRHIDRRCDIYINGVAVATTGADGADGALVNFAFAPMLGTWNNRGTPHPSMLNGSLDRVSIGYPHRLITTSTPFESGTGYNTYRIPSLVRTTAGTILAVCEGRASVSDDGNIDLVLRRSVDNGATWLTQQVLAGDSDTNNWRDNTLIVDGTRVHLICCWRHGDDSEAEVIAGTGVDTQRVYHLYSDDDGVTWTSPNEITSSVKGATERYISAGPGHGIKLTQGVYAGRLVVVGNVTDPTTFGDSLPHAMCFYSDDNGATWERGGTVATANTSEAQVFEAADGTLVMNIRDQANGYRRKVSTSTDGGDTWSVAAQDTVLIDPTAQGSVYRFSDDKIVFANPALTTSRDNLVLRIGAYDATKSGEVDWQQSIPVYRGKSAYSDLCAIGDDIGLLYEKGDVSQYEEIEFRRYAVGE